MSFTKDNLLNKTTSMKQLEEVIAKAIKKVGGNKENDLCKFIPMTSGGYMHHFTMRKMKTKNPSELSSMIEKFIINATKPVIVAPKQRAARGSRKRRDQIMFTKMQMERLLNMARLAGDKEMISVLSPRKSLTSCKRDLMSAIRQSVVDQELWNSYVEAVNAHQMISNAIANAQI